jgi:hypothetical protein
VLAKLETRPNYNTWKHAARLLFDKESSAEGITRQIELALLMDADLDARFASEQQKA